MNFEVEGRPFLAAWISGPRSMNSERRCGERRRTERRVGEMSLATGSSFRTSGWVSAWKRSRRARVGRAPPPEVGGDLEGGVGGRVSGAGALQGLSGPG